MKKARKQGGGGGGGGGHSSVAMVNAPAVAEDDEGTLHVNGASMEGGGQVLRNAAALAALLGRRLHVFRIRANRPRGGGLRAQHLHGLELVAQLYAARTRGFEVGSTEIELEPRGMRPDVAAATADPKTAGSVCLLLQVALPTCLFGPAPRVALTLRGGTNATMAPPVDYFLHVLRPMLVRMSGSDDVVSVRIKRRGFFPKGGGEVVVECNRVSNGPLKPIVLTEQGAIRRVTVHAFHTGIALRGDLGEAQVEAGLKRVFGEAVEVVWAVEDVKGAADLATGVTVVAESETGCLFGCSVLGEGKAGSKLAALLPEALSALERTVGKDGVVCVDEYLADQLVIFMALARGRSVIVTGPISLHTQTAIVLVSRITGAKFVVERLDAGNALIDVEDTSVDYEKTLPQSRFRITCDGIGFEPK